MKLLVTGNRGIPNIPGGVETHCQYLLPLVAKLGINTIITRRVPYIEEEIALATYEGVNLIDLPCSKKQSIEAFEHTLRSIFKAKKIGASIVHIHAVGPSLMVPVARLLGLKVVVTHHGPDYDRQKWGKLAKNILKLGEWCAARFANEVIVISETINDIMKSKYGRNDCHLIYNGVNLPEPAATTDYIQSLGLTKGKYVIAVGRFVPEKGLHDLIDAYKQVDTDYKLVLVGDADHESEYSLEIKEQAKKEGVVLTGFIRGKKLNEIFTHAGMFCMPSYHEGLPIALLEAMSYNLKVVVSDIPANKEIGLAKDIYFRTGGVEALAETIQLQLANTQQPNYRNLIQEKYNWENIAKQIVAVYRKLEK